MDEDEILKAIEGRWYLQYSGSPMWVREGISTVTFDYKLLHKGEMLVLEDKVEYMRDGKMRFRMGYDYPVEDIPLTFRWKGRGLNRFFRNRFEISIFNEKYIVLFFEKTVTSPTSIDVLTRDREVDDLLLDEIFDTIRNNKTVGYFLDKLGKVSQNQNTY